MQMPSFCMRQLAGWQLYKVNQPSSPSVMIQRARTLDVSDSFDLVIDGRPVTIAVRRSNRARRYTLRLAHSTGEPLLVIPWRGNIERGLDFVHSQTGWLRERLKTVPDRIPFDDGAEIPLRGKTHILRHIGGLSGTVAVRGRDKETGLRKIQIPGEEEHFSRRLTDWLKKEARADLEPAVFNYAGRLKVRPKRISIRDQSSRWGSCSAKGTLSFSWRLILAPPMVLDYLAAHEVAHLVEMNHSQRYWRTLERIAPDTHKAEAWLKSHGATLFRYGSR
jgi:predicted metal-dependent hydrolase